MFLSRRCGPCNKQAELDSLPPWHSTPSKEEVLSLSNGEDTTLQFRAVLEIPALLL